MTIVVNNPAIEDKRQVITLEFVNGTKFCMMSTPHRSKIAIDKGLYFNFSFIPASSYKRIAGGAQFAINTPGSGAEIAYMLCTVPLKAIKIGYVSLPLANIPTPADYTEVYTMALNKYNDSRFFDIFRQLLNYGWPNR